MFHGRAAESTILAVAVAVAAPTPMRADSGKNLLPNGGFERDTDGDGVPDGWVSHPHHFSRETLDHVQTYIAKLPSHKKLLDGKNVVGSDGWVLARRESNGTWGPYLKSAEWYRRMGREYLPQNSRFGQLPVPEGLKLGKTTMVIHNLPPHEQTISEPIQVKPNTGYRLSFWLRMAGGSEEAIFQVLGADAPRNDAWPSGGSKHNRHLITYLNLGWSWVPYWRRYEIAFRTGPAETKIRLRPWKYYRGYDDVRRAWFDDFRLVEDNSVRVGAVWKSVAATSGMARRGDQARFCCRTAADVAAHSRRLRTRTGRDRSTTDHHGSTGTIRFRSSFYQGRERSRGAAGCRDRKVDRNLTVRRVCFSGHRTSWSSVSAIRCRSRRATSNGR